MTLEQIDYFICTVQSRTFFDAAETMHISQSSLSKQIMKLEKELENIETLRKIDIFDFDNIHNEYLLEYIKKYGKQIY